MYDVNKLKSCTDISVVCDYLGINIYRHGSSARIDCPNPEHVERHHDNCSLYERNGRFFCYSCGASGNVVDMIMLNRCCSFKEALNILAEINGVKGDSVLLDKSSFRDIISKSDREFLDIQNSPIYSVEKITDCYDESFDKCEDLYISNEYGYACSNITMKDPLGYLYDNNPEAYKTMIREKARETLKYWEHFQEITHINADKEINRALNLYIKHGGVYSKKRKCLLGEAAEQVSSLF